MLTATGENGAAVFVFAALPITLLTALSKSNLGKKVQSRRAGGGAQYTH